MSPYSFTMRGRSQLFIKRVILYFLVCIVGVSVLRAITGSSGERANELDAPLGTAITSATLLSSQPPRGTEATAAVKRFVGSTTQETERSVAIDSPVECAKKSGKLMQFPLPGLEQELQRLGQITYAVAAEANLTIWPTDGTLLGLMRNGRVSTDRDLDYQIHSTYDQCFALLSSLKSFFEKRARIKSFKVVKIKHSGKKIGRYVMVRLFREFGTFDTGPDFNCVYMDEPQKPMYFTHRSALVPVPAAVYPLGQCLMYDTLVPCPRDGYSVLESLKPRYEGCMVFPHCFGDPLHSSRKCMSPHFDFPLTSFVESTRALKACGVSNLADHFEKEPTCAAIMKADVSGAAKRCETIDGAKICFVQKFDG